MSDDQLAAMRVLVHQERRASPPGVEIGAEQLRSAPAAVAAGGVGRRPRRADAGAGAAAGADVGVDATWSPSGAIAPVGHCSRQRVQPVRRERECAQSSASKAT